MLNVQWFCRTAFSFVCFGHTYRQFCKSSPLSSFDTRVDNKQPPPPTSSSSTKRARVYTILPIASFPTYENSFHWRETWNASASTLLSLCLHERESTVCVSVRYTRHAYHDVAAAPKIGSASQKRIDEERCGRHTTFWVCSGARSERRWRRRYYIHCAFEANTIECGTRQQRSEGVLHACM